MTLAVGDQFVKLPRTSITGQAAYEAYRAASDGVSLVTGATLPRWHEQADEIKAAWQAVERVLFGGIARGEAHVLFEVLNVEYTGNHREVEREGGGITVQSIVRIDAAVVR